MIYLISDGNDLIKIGYTTRSPMKRLQELQTGCSTRLRLIGTWEGDRITEKRIHYLLRFQRNRHKGEWFNLKPQQAQELLEHWLAT